MKKKTYFQIVINMRRPKAWRKIERKTDRRRKRSFYCLQLIFFRSRFVFSSIFANCFHAASFHKEPFRNDCEEGTFFHSNLCKNIQKLGYFTTVNNNCIGMANIIEILTFLILFTVFRLWCFAELFSVSAKNFVGNNTFEISSEIYGKCCMSYDFFEVTECLSWNENQNLIVFIF